MAGDTELLMGPPPPPPPDGVPDEGPCTMLATDMGGDRDEELLDSAVGEMSGDVLILIWMLLLLLLLGVVVEMDVGKKRAAGDVKSRGSRSMSHFRLGNREKKRRGWREMGINYYDLLLLLLGVTYYNHNILTAPSIGSPPTHNNPIHIKLLLSVGGPSTSVQLRILLLL